MKGDQLKLIDISLPQSHGLRNCAVHHFDNTITVIHGVKRIKDYGSGLVLFETDGGKGSTMIAHHAIKCVVPA